MGANGAGMEHLRTLLAIGGVLFNQDEAAQGHLSRNAGRAGTRKSVRHDAADGTKGVDEWRQRGYRFLRWVEFVAGVEPRQNIGGRRFRG